MLIVVLNEELETVNQFLTLSYYSGSYIINIHYVKLHWPSL